MNVPPQALSISPEEPVAPLSSTRLQIGYSFALRGLCVAIIVFTASSLVASCDPCLQQWTFNRTFWESEFLPSNLAHRRQRVTVQSLSCCRIQSLASHHSLLIGPKKLRHALH